MRYGWVLLALGLSALTSPLAAAEPEIGSFKLANGMEVIVISNHRVPAVSHMLWVRVGGADDPAGKSGLAHFHEHIMYQGTSRYPAGMYVDMVTEAGGEQNAFTGWDATAYYITVAKDKLPLAMSLEADRMRGLSPLNQDVEKEKEVIIEERRARIETNPNALFSEQMNAALWRNHPYRLPVIGWMHEMKTLDKDDVMRFHQRWYHPNNAFLVLSGDITIKEARPLVEQYYGSLPRGSVPRRNWNQEPPQNAERRIVMHHPNVKQSVWSRRYAAASLGAGKKEHALPLLILSQLLGGGKTSSLYRALVVEKEIASNVEISYDIFRMGPSSFEISIIPEPDTKMDELEKAVDEQLSRILTDGFEEKQITRAKTLLKAQTVYARDGLASMARIMGWLRIVSLDKVFFLEWPQLIDKVTLAQVQDAARYTFKPRQSVTGWLLPPEDKEGE